MRLKPKAPQTGYVEGAWWPRTDDLTAELPDLLAVPSIRLRRIDRVIYHLDEWAKPPAKLDTGGRKVPLNGYRYQPVNTLEVDHGAAFEACPCRVTSPARTGLTDEAIDQLVKPWSVRLRGDGRVGRG